MPSSVKGLGQARPPQPGHGTRHTLLLQCGPEEEATRPGLAVQLLSAVAENGRHRWTLRGSHRHPPGPGLCRSGWTPAPGEVADLSASCPLPSA